MGSSSAMSDHNVTRQILTEIERNPAISQKRLSEAVGISVGMINWHVKRCVSKGLVKLQHAPVRRYLYYLTQEGFAEKATLTAGYLRASFDIFIMGRQQYGALLALCEANGWTNVVLLGDSELTELALLVAGDAPQLTIMCIIGNKSTNDRRGGVPICTTVKDAAKMQPGLKIDAAISCHYDVRHDCDVDSFLADSQLDQARLLIPGFLQ